MLDSTCSSHTPQGLSTDMLMWPLQHLEKTGQKPSHELFKEIAAGIAAGEVDKLAETKVLLATLPLLHTCASQCQLATLTPACMAGPGLH